GDGDDQFLGGHQQATYEAAAGENNEGESQELFVLEIGNPDVLNPAAPQRPKEDQGKGEDRADADAGNDPLATRDPAAENQPEQRAAADADEQQGVLPRLRDIPADDQPAQAHYQDAGQSRGHTFQLAGIGWGRGGRSPVQVHQRVGVGRGRVGGQQSPT